MTNPKLIDTFPRFLAYWESVQGQSIDTQVELWAGEYLAPWPELLEKQLRDYDTNAADWRTIAKERIFPHIPQRLAPMAVARNSILAVYEQVTNDVAAALEFRAPVTIVVYVGIGCGAGWATRYDGSPAVLLGLENIAELGWTRHDTIRSLIAHEFGHLAHSQIRIDHRLPSGSGPWWQLYREGFAQVCEHVVTGKASWHMEDRDGAGDWLTWCQENKAWLAQEFLRVVDAGESTLQFFGSWYGIRGRSQTGYYLGYEVVRYLLSTKSLREIALLEHDDASIKAAVLHLATGR